MAELALTAPSEEGKGYRKLTISSCSHCCRPPDVAELALTAPSEEGKGYKALRKERPAGFDQV